MSDFGASLTDMSDTALKQLEDGLQAQIKSLLSEQTQIWIEQARRRVALRRTLRRPDPDQADHDEYIEEMSIGGQPYKPR